MPDDEKRILMDIAQKVGESKSWQEATNRSISDLTDNIKLLVEKLDKSDDVAKEALERSKSAQHQINEIKSDIKDIRDNHENSISKVYGTLKWMIYMGLTAAGVFIAALGFIWSIKH